MNKSKSKDLGPERPITYSLPIVLINWVDNTAFTCGISRKKVVADILAAARRDNWKAATRT